MTVSRATVAAICPLALAPAVDLRDGDAHRRARAMRDALRRHVPMVDADRHQDGDVAAVLDLVRAGGLPIEEPPPAPERPRPIPGLVLRVALRIQLDSVRVHRRRRLCAMPKLLVVQGANYARYDRPSVVAPAAQCVVMGIGAHGYILGLEAALHLVSRHA